MLTRKSLWLSCALLFVLVACTGSIEDSQSDGTGAGASIGDSADAGATSGSSTTASNNIGSSSSDTGSPATDTGGPATDTSTPPSDTGNPSDDTDSPPNDTSDPANDTSDPVDTDSPSDDTDNPSNDTDSPPDDTGNPPNDTSDPADDTSDPVSDTGNPPSDTGDPANDTSDPANDTGDPPNGECDRTGFTIVDSFPLGNGTHANGYAAYSENIFMLQDSAAFEHLSITFSEEHFPDGPEIAVYEFEDVGAEDCELCAIAYAGCTLEGGCERAFIATEGHLGISRIGDGLGGTILQAVFEEIELDPNGGLSSGNFVPNGQRWCMDSVGFDVEYNVAEPVDPAECSAPSTCVGDIVSDFDLQSCDTGEIVSFSSLNAGSGSVVANTAGWCAACRAWIPQLLDMNIPARGGNVIIALASDSEFQRPTLDYCRDYARRYGSENLRHFYIDSNYSVRQRMHVYRYGLPWNAVVLSNGEYFHGDGYNGSTRPDDAIERMLNGQ